MRNRKSNLTYCSHKPKYIVATNSHRLVLIMNLTWHFHFHSSNVSIIHLKYEYRARSESRFMCYSCSYVTRCLIIMGIVTAQYPSSHTCNIDVFKTIKRNSTTIVHIHNESANLIDNCDVAFDINNWWNQPKTLPMIGMESMVTRSTLGYTQDNLPLGICSLIKSTAMAKLISFPAKIITVML